MDILKNSEIFSDSVGTLESLQKSAISYLFSDPRLQLVPLNDREYMEGLVAYCSQNNEQEIMLEATLQALEKKISSQVSYSILGVGCGTGNFEEPFLENFLTRKKQIRFVGVEPDQKACEITQQWCEKLRRLKPTSFDFEIAPVAFENFKSHQSFDIILIIRSLYNFSDIEASVKKIYQLLREGGIAIIALGHKRQLQNEPIYHVYQRLYGKTAYYSEDVEKVLTQCNLPFYSETINCSVNITEFFQKGSQLGKLLLDFTIAANTAYFSPLQLRLLLDYFGTSSQKMESGEIVLPFLTDLFYIERKKNLDTINQ